MKLPSGMTTEQLREHCEQQIAKGVAGNALLVRSVDLLALLVALDLRERLDKDVERCAKAAKGWAETGLLIAPADKRTPWAELVAVADRVLKHEPQTDMTKAPS